MKNGHLEVGMNSFRPVPFGRPISETPRTGLSLLVTVSIVAYGLVLWMSCRPDYLQNWRESDTQTIARHLAEPDSSILYPRIDWGGTGPGYVEAEFQLYTWIISRFLIVFGDVEWPGQLVSLFAVLATAWVLVAQLGRRYGQVPAAIGTAAMLASRSVVQCATTVQPEALCLLLFAAAWMAFVEYADSGNRGALWFYTIAGGAAILVKPTAAQLGIASFLLLLLQSPHLLRRRAVWIAWALMVVALGLHLVHARSIYLEYGNTFGVLSGGDSKLPRLEHLLVPGLILRAGINSVMWGTGIVGAVATLVAIALGPRRAAPIVALLIANAAWTLLALRYTTRAGGNHYHLLGSILAAQAVAYALALSSKWRLRTHVRVLALCAIALAMERSVSIRLWNRINVWDQSAVAVAQALKRHSHPGDLIAVRSVLVQYDPYWKTVSNFEDPRVFNLTRTRGWPIGKEVSDPRVLDHAFREGARFYVEPEPRPFMPEFDAWLVEYARLLDTTDYGGKVYALSGAAATPQGGERQGPVSK
jgi:hypothetical protein